MAIQTVVQRAAATVCAGIQNILQEKYNVLQSSLLVLTPHPHLGRDLPTSVPRLAQDRLLIKNVCTVVSTRAARLAAAGIAAICNKVHQARRMPHSGGGGRGYI